MAHLKSQNRPSSLDLCWPTMRQIGSWTGWYCDTHKTFWPHEEQKRGPVEPGDRHE